MNTKKTKLREARENKTDLTQVEIAEKVGISPISYQRYESGKRTPTYATMKLIAKALNSSVDELF